MALDKPPELATLHIAPPAPPTEVRCALGAGTARVSWQAPEDDGGAPIVSYTVMSEVLGEDKARRHAPPMTDETSDLVGVSPTRLSIGPYATNKRVVVRGTGHSAQPPCEVTVCELAEGRAYRFCVTASNGSFDSAVSAWSNRVRCVPRRIADTRDNLVAVDGLVQAQYGGQAPYQGAYFFEREQAQGWSAEAIEGLLAGDADRVLAALMMDGAHVDLRATYERQREAPESIAAARGSGGGDGGGGSGGGRDGGGRRLVRIAKHERIFRYGAVEKLAFDGISALDAVATTGDTLLMLAIKLGDAEVVRAVLACGPDLSLRNARGQSAADVAQRRGRGMTKLLETAALPDPDRVARVFGAWQLVEDTETGGPPYYWNTITNAVQYKPPADPSAAPPHSVHDVLLHSAAWKGW